jgi:membrane protease YdiL (CAAX protease family)
MGRCSILAESSSSVSGAAPIVLACLGVVCLVLVWRSTRLRLPNDAAPSAGGSWPWPTLIIAGVGLLFAQGLFTTLGLLVPLAAGPSFATGTFEKPLLTFAGRALQSLVGYIPAVVLALFLLRIVTKSTPGARFSIALRDWRRAVLASALTLPIVALVSVVSGLAHQLIMGRPMDEVAHTTLQALIDNRNSPWVIALALCAVVMAPIVEEIVFRGFIQTGLTRAWGRPWWAIALTSIIFTAIHAGVVPGESFAFVAPTLLALSLAMGFAYERTGSLIVPIAIHITFNAFNFALALWGPAST